MTVTQSSSVTEQINSEAIDILVTHYQFDEVNFIPFARFKSMVDARSNVAAFTRWVKDAHTDIANETTSLTPVEMETTEVQCTMARAGIAREPSEQMLEDNILGRQQFMDELIMDAARLLGEAAEEDFAAQFANAGNAVTDSGNDLEIIDLVVAVGLQRSAKVRGPQVFCLADIQLSDLQDAQAADTGNAWNTFYSPNVDGSAFGGYFMGSPVFASGLNASANTNANKVGCLFAQGQAAPKYAAFGYALRRAPTTKFDEDILQDTAKMATISRYGTCAIATNFATKIVTDA